MNTPHPRGGTSAAPTLAAVLAIGCVLTAPSALSAAAARKPNVIVIVADDLGYGDLGFQGGKEIPTPNLDNLAKQGVRCTDGYASCPVCSPTRAGILTGRYQQRFGHEYNPSLGKDVGLPVTETTLADLLQSAGYATGALGKWHLGKEPQFHPLKRGFGEFYGMLGGAHYYVPTRPDPSDPFSKAFSEPLVRDHTVVDEPAHLTEALAQEAVAFIDRYRQQPFFLYLAFNAVHVPLQSTDAYLSRFPAIANKARRTYAAMLSAMDDAIGLVDQKLRDDGLMQDTLVVFLSDNGGHPMANAARNDPLRGEKTTVYEGGIRVPFVLRWPGHIPPGGTYTQPVISLDVLPTALGAAGVERPPGLALDGVDLLPYLTGHNDQPPHETLYWRYGKHRAIRRGKWKLTMPADRPPALYDLSQDVAESHDLAAAHPEIVAELNALYERWNATLQPPRWRDLILRNAGGDRRKGPGDR